MEAQAGLFLSLTTLQQELKSTETISEIEKILTSFLVQRLKVETVAIEPTAVSATDQILCFSIDHTGYWLILKRASSFSDEETALGELIVALVANAPFFQQILARRQMQHKRWAAVRQITAAGRRLRPLPETLEALLQQLTFLFNNTFCYIAIHDADAHQIQIPFAEYKGERRELEPISSLDDRSLIAWVVVNQQGYVTGDWPNDDHPVPGQHLNAKSRSVIISPLIVGEEVVGAISVQHEEPNVYSAADFERLQAIADEVAVIIRNTQRYQQTQDLVDKGTRDYQTAVALRQAISVIGTSLDPQVIMRNLLLALGDLFPYRHAEAYLWQEDTLYYGAGRDFDDRPLPLNPRQAEAVWRDNPLVEMLVEERDPIILDPAGADPRWPSFPGGEAIAAWMGVPVVIGGQALGLLMVYGEKTAVFDRHKAWLASTLANHAGVALQNARLHQQTQQQLREIGTLFQASATMTANLDQDFVLRTVVSEMVRAVQVDSCSIFVWDEAHQHLKLAAHEHQLYPQKRPEETETIEAQPPGLGKIENLVDYPVVKRVFETREIHSLRHDNAYSPHHIALLEAANLQSILLVPLVRRDTVLGLLALGQMAESRTFTQSELRLTQNLAGQAAVAIEHAHLFAQAQRRVDELSTFHNIVLQLNTPLKLNRVLDTITEAALKLVNASNMHIFLYDESTQQFTYGSALWRNGSRKPAVDAPRENGLTMAVVRKGSPIVIDDANDHPLFQAAPARAWGICAIAGFPLKQEGKVIGVFTTTYLQPHTFSEDELLLLNLLADQAAVAVKNARLYDQSQRRLRDMSALVDMAKQVTSNLNLESVLDTTVNILRRLLGARASTITMLSDDEQKLVVKAAAGISPAFAGVDMKLGEGVSGAVVRQNKPIYIRDAYEEPDFLFFDEVVRSLLVVPLIIRDEARGTLTVDSDEPNAFANSDIQLMTIAAAQVSIALSNAHLFQELEDRATELEKANAEIRESERLKDELVQNVSHELRTPLTFVKGYVDLLMDGEMGLMNQEQQEALQIVATKTNEITRLIDDIITLQRIDRSNLELELVSMSSLVKTAVAGHMLVAKKQGLTIDYYPPEDEADMIVAADTGRINQVLANLIGNAIKFSPDGGTITISLSNEGDNVLLSVRDEGIGVPQNKIERIFERFYQVDGSSRRRFGGTGLGLAIVKRIIDAHQGKIWVESAVNEGSTFYFTLPKEETVA